MRPARLALTEVVDLVIILRLPHVDSLHCGALNWSPTHWTMSMPGVPFQQATLIIVILRCDQCHSRRTHLAEVVRTAEHYASLDLIPTQHTAVVLHILAVLLYLIQIPMSSLTRLQVLLILVTIGEAFLDGILDSSFKVYGADSVTKLL